MKCIRLGLIICKHGLIRYLVILCTYLSEMKIQIELTISTEVRLKLLLTLTVVF